MKKTIRKHLVASLVVVLIFRLNMGSNSRGSEARSTVSLNYSTNIGYHRINTVDDPENGIYVYPVGHDPTATGTIDSPFTSINAALEAAEPGDTIILRGGAYNEGISVRVMKPNITIKSAKGEWAIIDLRIYNDGHEKDSGVIFDVGSSGSRLQGVEVYGGYYAVSLVSQWEWGDPIDNSGASDIIIEDCILHDSLYDVISIKPYCNNVTIRNNDIYNSGRAVFYGQSGSADGIINNNGSNMKLQGNYIYDIYSTGVCVKGGAIDTLIEGNRVERTGDAGILIGFDSISELIDTKKNQGYYENTRCTVRNNLIVDTGLSGIGLFASIDAMIYNNTLINVASNQHSAIYLGVNLQDWEANTRQTANVNPSIHSNIISQPRGYGRPMIEIQYTNELGSLSALDGSPQMNNNCYYVSDGKATFTDMRLDNSLDNGNLADWQNHINGDSGSIEMNPDFGINYLSNNPLCENMGIQSAFVLVGTSSPDNAVSNFTRIKVYSPQLFADLDDNAWYAPMREGVVAYAYEYGFMSGYPNNTFRPNGEISIAEVITIAARLHSIFASGADRFEQGTSWYQVYVDYAISNGLIGSTDFSSYTQAATRAEMAYVFAGTLPESEFPKVNIVNNIPDYELKELYSSSVFLLYEAGIVGGSDEVGSFNPDNNITRAEAAAIITRIILPTRRFHGRTYG